MSFHSLADRPHTRSWIKSFVGELKPPCVILLKGEMGSGKTQLVRWFLEELGVADVASPTFAIHHEYRAASGQRIDHVDLYRVQTDEELEATGFWDLFAVDDGIVFVEWADLLPFESWPQHWKRISLRLIKPLENSEARELELEIRQPGEPVRP